jgi:hypothetical protein
MLISTSSDCLDEAKRRVLIDPESNRSWNYCWLVLTKVQSEYVTSFHFHARLSHMTTVISYHTMRTIKPRCQQCGAIKCPRLKAYRPCRLHLLANGIMQLIRCCDTGSVPLLGATAPNILSGVGRSSDLILKADTLALDSVCTQHSERRRCIYKAFLFQGQVPYCNNIEYIWVVWWLAFV